MKHIINLRSFHNIKEEGVKFWSEEEVKTSNSDLVRLYDDARSLAEKENIAMWIVASLTGETVLAEGVESPHEIEASSETIHADSNRNKIYAINLSREKVQLFIDNIRFHMTFNYSCNESESSGSDFAKLIVESHDGVNLVYDEVGLRDFGDKHKTLYSYNDVHDWRELTQIQQYDAEKEGRVPSDDLTLVMPVHIESEERLQNAKITIDWITRSFSAKLHVMESGSRPRLDEISQLCGAEYEFSFSEGIFDKNTPSNTVYQNACTEFVGQIDADCILSKQGVFSALNFMRNKDFDFVIPFSLTYDVPLSMARKMLQRESFLALSPSSPDVSTFVYDKKFSGLSILYKRDAILDAGGENTEFYGWGHDDIERTVRLSKLGYRGTNVIGATAHIRHEKSQASGYYQGGDEINVDLLKRSKDMSASEMREYAKMLKEANF